jgi:hypothetical protein
MPLKRPISLQLGLLSKSVLRLRMKDFHDVVRLLLMRQVIYAPPHRGERVWLDRERSGRDFLQQPAGCGTTGVEVGPDEIIHDMP